MGMEHGKAKFGEEKQRDGPESLKGLLQCGALGSTELARSGWNARALQETWQEQNTNFTSSASGLSGMDPCEPTSQKVTLSRVTLFPLPA